MENTLPTMDRHEFFRLVGTGIGAILLGHTAFGCAEKTSEDPTPVASQKIDFTIQLNEQNNANLMNKGGFVVVNNVIVAQTQAGNFLAVSALCTHPEGKSQLVYRASENQFYCPLHLDRFDATGKVVLGPAKQALTQYQVAPNLSSGTLRIFQ
jgi:cytochrome b6-f complex iron-sulfur subunit